MAYFWTSSVNLLKYTESAGNNKSRLPNISVRVWNSYVLKLRRKWSKKWLHFPILNLYFSLKLHSIYVYFFVMRLGFSYCRIKSVVFDTKSAGSRSPCLLPYSFKSPIELYITRFFWSLLLQLAQSVHIPRFIFFLLVVYEPFRLIFQTIFLEIGQSTRWRDCQLYEVPHPLVPLLSLVEKITLTFIET